MAEDFETERKAIVGNLLATLQACDALLEENRKLRRRYRSDLENLDYRLFQQEKRVDDLRTRLNFHCEKIRLVLDRLSIYLLTDVDAKVDDLLSASEQAPQAPNDILIGLDWLRSTLSSHVTRPGNLYGSASPDAHPVSARIAQTLQEFLFVDAPLGMELGIPMTQGFDALLRHFKQSGQGSDHTPEKYLLFLKTRWLYDRIKASRDYQRACPGFYYKRAVNQIGKAILEKARRPGELVSYDENVLMNLPESCFLIWPPKPVATPTPPVESSQAHPLVVRANEEQIVCIELASDGLPDPDSVTIFKSSDERFRIVLKTTLGGEKLVIPQPVYTSEDKLIPRYALPTLINPSLEIAIFSRNEETLYKFDSFKDLYSFQAALTGYDVSHDQSDIRWQFSDDVCHLDGSGRIQLWQEPIVFASVPEDNGPSHESILYTQHSLYAASQSRRDSLIPSIAPTNTINWTTGGWEGDSIKLPVITIFTQLADKRKRSRFAVISIELEPGIEIDPTECGCCRGYNKCSTLVLVNRKKRDFTVRTCYSDIDSTGQPNPNTFDLLPLRMPRHPTFHNINVSRTQYLVLKFNTLPEKQLFHDELSLRFKVRDKQIKDQRDFVNTIRHRQNRPQRRQTSASYSQRPAMYSSQLSSVISLPPQLEVPDIGPGLVDSFTNGSNSNLSRSSPYVSPIIPSPISPRTSNRDDADKIDSWRSNSSRARSTPYSPRLQSISGSTTTVSSPEAKELDASSYRQIYPVGRSRSIVAPENVCFLEDDRQQSYDYRQQNQQRRVHTDLAAVKDEGGFIVQSELLTSRNKGGKRKEKSHWWKKQFS